jgi:microsomal dipeptidase-like Zn-dependent dipeptidase
VTTSADLARLAPALSVAGFSDDDIRSIMGGNWLRFFADNLP